MNLLKNLSRKDIAASLVCMVFLVAEIWLELKMPEYTQRLTSSAVEGNISMETVRYNGTYMLLCATGALVLSCLCRILTAKIAADFSFTLRGKLFEKVTGFSDAEYNRLTTPSLITRVTDDVTNLNIFFTLCIQILVRAPIMAAGAIGKISNAGIEWTVATLVAVVIIVISVVFLIYICMPRFKLTQKLTDELNEVVGENIAGVRVVRAFNAERFRQEKFDGVNAGITKNSLFTGRVMGILTPVLSVSLQGLTLAIYWIGASLISQAAAPDKARIMGNMVVFVQYAMQVIMAFTLLSVMIMVIPKMMVSAKRINEVLDTVPSVTYPEKAAECARTGSIEFRNVSFSYNNAPGICLKGLNFSIRSGETFAIIGATSAGKTSLVGLIPRHYDALEGEVLVDGVNVRNYTEAQLEKKISIATQKAIIFSGDIKSNVIYGAENDVPDDDVRLNRALATAQADFADPLEGGIHCNVAQGGTNLSGGQKQRLSIARTIYKDAEIYIFDDTFSALDFRTDMLLRRALKKELAGKTVIMVAQRIGTIMNADRILVLNDGEAVGLGTHKELLASCPVYKELALTQLSEEEL